MTAATPCGQHMIINFANSYWQHNIMSVGILPGSGTPQWKAASINVHYIKFGS